LIGMCLYYNTTPHFLHECGAGVQLSSSSTMKFDTTVIVVMCCRRGHDIMSSEASISGN